MLPDRVLNPGPLTYESGVLSIALRGPAVLGTYLHLYDCSNCITQLCDLDLLITVD